MINLIAKILNNRYKRRLEKDNGKDITKPVKKKIKTIGGGIPKPPISRKRGFKDFDSFSYLLNE